MHGKAAEYFDKIYSLKDYSSEAEKIHFIIQKHNPKARTVLDVGCGAGGHITHLKDTYEVQGLDISRELVCLARKRLPNVVIRAGNMMNFSIHEKFDIILCLFSTIGYAGTRDRLGKTIKNMARHLSTNGVLIIEPWFTKDAWKPQDIYATFVDEPFLKIARISNSRVVKERSIIEMHYLIGNSEGTRYYHENHEMGLFSEREMIDSFRSAKLECIYEKSGITGRGIYIGKHAE